MGKREAREKIGPTPETRAKAQEGVIGYLARLKDRSGTPFLWPEHVEAAFLIEDGYRAFTSPVACRLMKYEHSAPHFDTPEFMAELDKKAAEARDNYFAWSEWMVETGKAVAHAVVMDIAVDGNTLPYTERKRQLDRGDAKHILKMGLTEYARLTGKLPKSS